MNLVTTIGQVSNFPNEMAIEGTLNKEFKFIHPQDFHSKFLKNGLCTIDNSYLH